MSTIYITGANRGIGFETGRRLASMGHRVYFGTRRRGADGQPVDSVDANAAWASIDVADSADIQRAGAWLAEQEPKLDVLINNAGIFPDADRSILELPRAQYVETFQTNTFGPIDVVKAFLPLLRLAPGARIVNVSSGYGQLDGLSADVPSYCLSKLTLNGVTRMLATKLGPEGIAVNSVCPGWVRTEMGGPNAPRSIEEGAAGIVWLAAEAPSSVTGKFFRDGAEIEW